MRYLVWLFKMVITAFWSIIMFGFLIVLLSMVYGMFKELLK